MAKVINYTDDMASEMKKAYLGAWGDTERKEVVENMATKFGKTVASIRAKMSRDQYYQKPTKTTKAGGTITKKAELVENVASELGVPSEVIESLEKATKVTIELILKNLQES